MRLLFDQLSESMRYNVITRCIRVFHFSPLLKFKMLWVLSDEVLDKNQNIQILVDYDVIRRVHFKGVVENFPGGAKENKTVK